MLFLPFANIRFPLISQEQILAPQARPLLIVTVNAQILGLLNEHPALLAAANERFTPVVDGQIVLWGINRRAAKQGLKFGKISGSDFIHAACVSARERGLSVALIGATQASNDAAVHELQRQYGIQVTGYSPPLQSHPFPESWVAGIRSHLEMHKPSYVFVGFGAPKQEFFMLENAALFARLGCEVVVGCGGTFDFVSGLRSRAPGWVSRAGLEGVYRLVLEPRWYRLRRLWDSLLAALRYFGD